MERALLSRPDGFEFGLTPIITRGEQPEMGLDFFALRLRKEEHFDLFTEVETAILLLKGDVTISYDQKTTHVQRRCFFDEAPTALHCAGGQSAKISAHDESEFILVATENDARFLSELYTVHNMLENEHRGQDLLNDTAYRMVRTIFDKRNRPTANLVLGEVITFPGRWSSYPPHYHAQPEVYHYRFTEPQGYGHAELGERVFKVRSFDTLMILDNNTHAQVSAPGYGMYYVWAIRHLPNDPYIMPTFVDEHVWTKDRDANQRVWQYKKLPVDI